ncbi:MAG: hypothetical protein QOJ90_43 [Actinomycetota bacterium]|nr:hypothetical protein [Actinomycetota bacterium]
MAEPGTDPAGPGRRRVGVQGRLTLAATGLVAVVLVIGALGLLLSLRYALLSTLDDSARQRARDVATLVDNRTLPRSVPVAGGTVLVQVVDNQGRVRAASPGGDALVPVLSGGALADARRGKTQIVPGSRIGVEDTLRVVATVAGPTSDRQTVLVAVSSTEAAHSLRIVTWVFGIGVPLLVAAFSAACWFLVGAALRPVASLRRGASEITEAGATTRLTVPPTRDEVARLAGTLNDMLDRLAAGSARNRAFVADAAHELRSPLASMRTQLEVGRAHPRHAEWDEISAGVLEDLQRLTRLVDDLLVLARLDDGHGAAKNARTTDLRAVATAGVTRMALRNKVHLVPPDDPVLALVDPDAAARVIDNLLSNADRHATSLITVEVRDGHGWAVLSVSDDGPGIPVGERDRVFQRFTRLDESRSQYSGGSGLGLAIVHQVMRSAGGSIVLEDAGPGLRAVVTLPKADPPGDDASQK